MSAANLALKFQEKKQQTPEEVSLSKQEKKHIGWFTNRFLVTPLLMLGTGCLKSNTARFNKGHCFPCSPQPGRSSGWFGLPNCQTSSIETMRSTAPHWSACHSWTSFSAGMWTNIKKQQRNLLKWSVWQGVGNWKNPLFFYPWLLKTLKTWPPPRLEFKKNMDHAILVGEGDSYFTMRRFHSCVRQRVVFQTRQKTTNNSLPAEMVIRKD